ncbi:MAG: A/G-specific adenine glycosylase [Lachnospiraceae bacterium]|nr:A/G-specific adenine glycosylase [Lachnospiraceae bacterium]
MKKEEISALIAWYEKNKRDLPWREDPSAYHVYVSEIMLQQTRVEAVKAYYLRFLTELPDIEALAAVREERLLKLWEGLGYYSRAKNLKKTAEIVVRDYKGKLPEEAPELRKLPGIGDYTAGAVSSIAYKKAEVAADGNVFRVFARFRGDERNITEDKTRRAVREELKAALRAADLEPERYGIFNQAVMDLGAVVCLPAGAPLCEKCPLNSSCRAHADKKESSLPVKTAPKKRRTEKRTVLILFWGERILIRKRPDTGLLAGMYEFPNLEGHLSEQEVRLALEKIEKGMSAAADEAQKICPDLRKEQSGVWPGMEEIEILRLPRARHIFSHIEWDMEGYLIRFPANSANAPGSPNTPAAGKSFAGEAIWACREELSENYSIPTAFKVYTRIALDILG